MRTTLGRLRREIREAKAAASPEYMKKERVREALQALVAGMVSRGEVTDQATLDEAFGALDMSLGALKMVPFEVWQGMATGGAKPARRK
jgi:hypothetical protein